MPQQSMFPDHVPAAFTGLQITAEPEWKDQKSHLRVEVRVRLQNGEWRLRNITFWQGFELDYIGTFYERVTSAWAWGDRGDIDRAIRDVRKAAKEHHDRHSLG